MDQPLTATSPVSNVDSEGSAYGQKPGTCDRELTEVGPGTPCGEFMRRY